MKAPVKKTDEIIKQFAYIKELPLSQKIEVINELKLALHELSPFLSEPVDCVVWVKNDTVQANDYNPNTVAPPEMKLLQRSIEADGYTQPIVAWKKEKVYEVVDGFHRNRVGKECKSVTKRIHGYLPISVINTECEDRGDRIASTIRHNRARGKHRVNAMSDIVVELKRRNWSNERICRDLGMEEDEVLRLCQITGLAELFSDAQFSKSWEADGEITEADFKELTDNTESYGEEVEEFRTVNTSDDNRVFHTYEKWECYKAGFYANTVDGKTKQECEEIYRDFLSDTQRFSQALQRVITEWKNSCEHYLSNSAMNRIAWLGQASLCIETGIPATFRGGFALMTLAQQQKANETAHVYLNKWLASNGRNTISLEEALSTRQSDIY